MKAVNINTNIQDFKNDVLKELQDYYGDIDNEVFENSFAFKLPFGNTDLWAAMRYNYTILAIGDSDIKVSNNDKQVFYKNSQYTTLNVLMLKDSSITLLQIDSSTTWGGTSLYSIADTDNGVIAFTYCRAPRDISTSKSIHAETNKDITPLTFGNQYISKDNEVLKQPLKFTDQDGVIYTCKDIYNISYKPEDAITLPKSFISHAGYSNEVNRIEKFNTSILIYDEED